jgi:hypothetical protein
MYEVTIAGLSQQTALLQQYPEIATQELQQAMQLGTLAIVREVRPLAPVYRGALRQSLVSTVVNEGNLSIVGRVGSNLSGEVYPAVMEFGRAPGRMPPVEALREWAGRVLGDEGLAYVVARAIGARGIRGRAFLRTGFSNAAQQVIGYFNQALDNIVRRIGRGGG